MRRLGKGAVVVGFGAFLLALMWWLPVAAYAGAEDEGAVRKYVALGSTQKIVKLGSIKFLKVR